ncbi:MAG: right-handed parallel beta-helix repeat-containing protein, partial [Candidatus Aenigmatarchaeota archaeon]
MFTNLRQGVFTFFSSSTIINNTIYDNMIRGILLQFSDSTIMNNTIRGNTIEGIWLESSDSSTIVNNKIHNNFGNGIFTSFSTVNIENNTLHSNRWQSVNIMESDSTFTNNTIYNTSGTGVYVSSSNVQFFRNKIYNNSVYAIDAQTTNSTFSNNTIYNNSWDGIHIFDSNSNITNNTIYMNELCGVRLTMSSSNITNNTFRNNLQSGMFVDTSNVTVVNNSVYDNTQHGIGVRGSQKSNIINNTAYDNGWNGLWVTGSRSNITNNTLRNNSNGGITVSGLSVVDVANNIVYNNPIRGVYVLGSNATISNNTVYNNTERGWDSGYGFQIELSNVSLINNTVYRNSNTGIYLMNTNSNISNNSVYNNSNHGIHIDRSLSRDISNNVWNNTIWNNTRNGIYTQSSNSTIANNSIWNNSGGGISTLSSNSNISNNSIYSNVLSGINNGIYSNSTITNNTIRNNSRGINAYANSFIKVDNNTIYDNRESGIATDTTSSMITNNTVHNNSGEGIFMMYSNSSIINNEIYNNTYSGVYSFISVLEIANNTVHNNSHNGIYPQRSNFTVTNNKVYDNNIVGIVVLESLSDVVNNTVYNNNDRGVIVETSIANITNNSVYNNENGGIYNWQSNSSIINNTIRDNMWYGINVGGSDVVITDNVIYNNSQVGVEATGITSTFVNNTVYNHSYVGVQIRESKINMTGNLVYNNSWHGVDLLNIRDSNVSDNEVYNNTEIGVGLYASSGNIVKNNIIQENGQYDLDVTSDSCVNDVVDNIGSGDRDILFYNGCGWVTSGSTTAINDEVLLDTNTKKLYFQRDNLASARSSLSSSELPTLLESGSVIDNSGTEYRYNVYIEPGQANLTYSRYSGSGDPGLVILAGDRPLTSNFYNTRIVFQRPLDVSLVQGRTIKLFGQTYYLGYGSELSNSKITLYGGGSEVGIDWGVPGTPSTQTVCVGGKTISVTVDGINSNGNSADFTIDGFSNTATTGTFISLPSGIRVYVKSILLYATGGSGRVVFSFYADKLEISNNDYVRMGTNLDIVKGTWGKVVSAGSTTIASIDVDIYGPDFASNNIPVGMTRLDQVFKTFALDFKSAQPSLDDPSRDMIHVSTSGDNYATVSFMDYRGLHKTLTFASNYVGGQSVDYTLLQDTSPYDYNVEEGVELYKYNYTIINQNGFSHILQITDIDMTSTVQSVTFRDIISAVDYNVLLDNKWIGSLFVDGKQYYVSVTSSGMGKYSVIMARGSSQRLGTITSPLALWTPLRLKNGEELVLVQPVRVMEGGYYQVPGKGTISGGEGLCTIKIENAGGGTTTNTQCGKINYTFVDDHVASPSWGWLYPYGLQTNVINGRNQTGLMIIEEEGDPQQRDVIMIPIDVTSDKRINIMTPFKTDSNGERISFDWYVTGTPFADKALDTYGTLLTHDGSGQGDVGISYPDERMTAQVSVKGTGISYISRCYICGGKYDLSGLTASEVILCNADDSKFTDFNVMGSDKLKNNGMVLLSTDRTVVDGLYSAENYAGVRLYDSRENNISNSELAGNKFGSLFGYSHQNQVFNTVVVDSESGMRFEFSAGNELYWNTLSGNEQGVMFLNGANGNQFHSSSVENNGDGVVIVDSISNSIMRNNVAWNSVIGFRIMDNSNNNVIWNNIINNTNNLNTDQGDDAFNVGKDCIVPNIVGGKCIGGNFWGDTKGTGFSDMCKDSDRDGICNDPLTLPAGEIDEMPLSVPRELECGSTITVDTTLTGDIKICSGHGLIIGGDDVTLDCNGHSIIGNNVIGTHGIHISSRSNVLVVDCNIQNFEDGIFSEFSLGGVFRNNTIHENIVSGIRSDSSNTLIKNNSLYDNTDRGIVVSRSNFTITQNKIIGSDRGVQLQDLAKGTMSDNTISNSGNIGLYIIDSKSNTITNNVIQESGLFDLYVGDTGVECRNNIKDNVGSGNRPILFYSGTGYSYGGGWPPVCGNGAVEVGEECDDGVNNGPSPACCSVSCTNNNPSCGGGGGGVISSFLIHDITASEIILCGSQGSEIRNVNISGSDSLDNNGLLLVLSSGTILTGNSLSGNAYGLLLSSSEMNTIHKNNMTDNRYGIMIVSSNLNQVFTNDVSRNSESGLWLTGSYSNKITDNIFNNTIDLTLGTGDNYYGGIKDCTMSNILGGRCMGGNYWGDNQNTGFSDTCADVNYDGICDDPLVFSSSDSDELPLA